MGLDFLKMLEFLPYIFSRSGWKNFSPPGLCKSPSLLHTLSLQLGGFITSPRGPILDPFWSKPIPQWFCNPFVPLSQFTNPMCSPILWGRHPLPGWIGITCLKCPKSAQAFQAWPSHPPWQCVPTKCLGGNQMCPSRIPGKLPKSSVLTSVSVLYLLL